MRTCPYCAGLVSGDGDRCPSCAGQLSDPSGAGEAEPTGSLPFPYRLVGRVADGIFAHAGPIALGLVAVWAVLFLLLILA